ncbi:hypothetical protein [Haloarchaeobius sp. HRN-SO-5]|uniref:hypothetical protein n=1 Tax=Haloarchaeobius sp. HRN-SO-5 TaxID=3446118 RepID=UPI003EC0D760
MKIYECVDSLGQSGLTGFQQDPIRPEAALESILHANPELILDEPLLIIGRQVRLDSGVPDLIACDQYGNIVVVEVKIGRSGTGSASEETILSQPQMYASSLQSYDYTALDELYQDYCRRLENGEWEGASADVAGDTLRSAVEARFGKELAEHEFNTYPRIVVAAEKITPQTAEHAQFLVDKEVHFQCIEVQRFTRAGEGDRTVFARSTIVDYDLDRVRPKNRPRPTYPELIAEIVEPIFPQLREAVHTDTLSVAFPDGFNTRGAALESRHPAHPEGIIYYVSPEPDMDRVTIGVHNKNEIPEVGEKINAEREAFEQAGLTVKDNQRYNVVWKRWSTETVGEVRGIREDISEHYKRMVLLGHDALTGRGV